MKRLACVAAGLGIVVVCDAATLTVGDHEIQPSAGQTITIGISGGEEIQAIQLMVAVEDGGPRPTAMDPKTGTVLQDSTFAVDPAWISGNMAYTDYSMQFGATATASGIAATVTLDATGLAPGSEYEVQLTSAVATSQIVGAEGELNPTLVAGTVRIAGGGSGDGSPPPDEPVVDGGDDPASGEEPVGPDDGEEPVVDTGDSGSEPEDPAIVDSGGTSDTPVSDDQEPGGGSGGTSGTTSDSNSPPSEQSPVLTAQPATCAAGAAQALWMCVPGFWLLSRLRRP